MAPSHHTIFSRITYPIEMVVAGLVGPAVDLGASDKIAPTWRNEGTFHVEIIEWYQESLL
jgi:hypothetical protein